MRRRKDISPAVFHYLVLIFVLVFSLWTFMLFNFDKVKQFEIILGVSIFYFLWSIFFHFQRRDLTLKVITEYFFISLLAITCGFVIFIAR